MDTKAYRIIIAIGIILIGFSTGWMIVAPRQTHLAVPVYNVDQVEEVEPPREYTIRWNHQGGFGGYVNEIECDSFTMDREFENVITVWVDGREFLINTGMYNPSITTN